MRRNRSNLIKEICEWICLIGGSSIGLYVGGWVMFVRPIIEACKHFDAGTLTGVIVGVTILKCIFASSVGRFIAYVGIVLAKAIDRAKW